jgi:hypothetical protein
VALFELAHTWLGTIVGETVGYALTAAFTVLVAGTVTRAVAPRAMVLLGYASAGLIATGVLVPLGLHAATLTNFAGYGRLVPLAPRHGGSALAGPESGPTPAWVWPH